MSTKFVKKTIVLDLKTGTFTHFSGLDIISALILSGGTAYENLNILQDSDGNIKQYPTPAPTAEDTRVTTGQIPLPPATRLRRLKAGFQGDNTTIEIKAYNPDFPAATPQIIDHEEIQQNYRSKEYTGIENQKPRGIPNNLSRCRYFQAIVKNADILDTLSFEIL